MTARSFYGFLLIVITFFSIKVFAVIDIHSKEKIDSQMLNILQNVKPDDVVRIHMIRFANKKIINAIKNIANQRLRSDRNPVLLLLNPLDSSLVEFNDGTPNKQNAFLLKEATTDGNIRIRWYSPNDQNNMDSFVSVTNEYNKKYNLFTSSYEGIDDLFGEKPTQEFINNIFDSLFNNTREDNEFSQDYETNNLCKTFYMIEGHKQIQKIELDKRQNFKKLWIKKNDDTLVSMLIAKNDFIRDSERINDIINYIILNDDNITNRLMFTAIGIENINKKTGSLNSCKSDEFRSWKKRYLTKI